ncbi:hypothetical protein [Clostridium acidisoli]
MILNDLESYKEYSPYTLINNEVYYMNPIIYSYNSRFQFGYYLIKNMRR